MNTNNIKAKMAAGEKAYGCGFQFPCLQIVEMVGLLGFDYIFIDGEHGTFTLTDIEQMGMVAERRDMTVLARVPNIHPSTILRFLDRGVMGITGPHICTRADAETLVKACKYAPQGMRSYVGHRVKAYGIPDDLDIAALMAQVNEEVLVSAQIEDALGLENLPEILKVDGLDVVGFGPNDLAQSLGHPGQSDHPEVVQAMVEAEEQIRASGRALSEDMMDHASVVQWIAQGGRDFLRTMRGK